MVCQQSCRLRAFLPLCLYSCVNKGWTENNGGKQVLFLINNIWGNNGVSTRVGRWRVTYTKEQMIFLIVDRLYPQESVELFCFIFTVRLHAKFL